MKRYIFPVCAILWNALESQNSRRSSISSPFLTCHISEKYIIELILIVVAKMRFYTVSTIFKTTYNILWKNILSSSISNDFLFFWVWNRLPDIFRVLCRLHFASGFPGESCGNWYGSPRDHNILWVSTSSSTSEAAIDGISISIPGIKKLSIIWWILPLEGLIKKCGTSSIIWYIIHAAWY